MQAEVKQQVLKALETAIQAEIEGYHFFKMAANSTHDPRGREVFENLAEEEKLHARWLRAQHKSIENSGEFDVEAEFGTPIHDPESPIFSEALKSRAASAHFEMTALSVGVQLEADAQQHYREMAEMADHPEVSDLFRKLADWEYAHYHALLVQLEALKEEYWSANRFAPF
mgnify:CR=1 FL=1